MQQTELTTLAIDVGMTTDKFSMTRVINIFRRADQVDDTKKATAADSRVSTGEDAKSGDRGLELHEFLECVVLLAFERTNPLYGQVGYTNKTYEIGADGDTVRKVEPKIKWITLPGEHAPPQYPPSPAFSHLPTCLTSSRPSPAFSRPLPPSPTLSHPLPPSPDFSHLLPPAPAFHRLPPPPTSSRLATPLSQAAWRPC